MRAEEAREIRAVLTELLNPLIAARAGTIPPSEGIERAIGVAQRLDDACRTKLFYAQISDDAARRGAD